MTLGSEFRFHGSINKRPQKGPGMLRYEVKSGKEWTPLARMANTEKVDALRALLTARGRKAGIHYRIVDLDKPAAPKRARKPAASAAEINAEDTAK